MNNLIKEHLEKFKNLLSNKNYSSNTVTLYLSYLSKFLCGVDSFSSQINGKAVSKYLTI